jgi:hypothetical protein
LSLFFVFFSESSFTVSTVQRCRHSWRVSNEWRTTVVSVRTCSRVLSLPAWQVFSELCSPCCDNRPPHCKTFIYRCQLALFVSDDFAGTLARANYFEYPSLRRMGSVLMKILKMYP